MAASDVGRFDVVDVLLNAGADPDQLGWTPLHQAVDLGTLADVRMVLADGADLTARDWWWWGRTPWLLALQIGDIGKAEALLAAGATLADRGS